MKLAAGLADADFVAFVINSTLGRQQINAISRQIIGQANVNSEELRSLRIPLPPLQMQRTLVARIAEARAEIARQRIEADRLAAAIAAETEARVLGTAANGRCT